MSHLRKSGPPTGGLQRALFILHMHWHKERTTDGTRVRHVQALRDECRAFLERTEEYYG